MCGFNAFYSTKSAFSGLLFLILAINYYFWADNPTNPEFYLHATQMNLNHIDHRTLTPAISPEDVASLEKACTLMGLAGYYLLQSSSSFVSSENTELLLHSFVNPAYVGSRLPSNEILVDLVMQKLEADLSTTPVHFEITTLNNGSESSRINTFLTKSDKLPGILAIFFKGEEPFTPGQMEGLEFVYNLICDSVQKKRTIELLEHEKTRYGYLFSATPEAIIILDKDNCIEEANPGFVQLFQYSKNQLIGKEVDTLIAPGKLNEEAVLLSQSNWRGVQVSVETKRQRRDGTLCDVMVTGVPFYHADGQMRVFGIYRDISERVKAETQKQERIEFIEYIGGLSSAFINTDISSIDSLIAQALKKVGKSHFAERAYLVMLNEDRSRLEFTYEWAEDARFSHRNTLAHLAVDEIAEYIKCLESGSIFNLSRNDVGKIKGTDNLESFFDLQNVESLLHIPLFFEHEFLGFIGFDTYSRPIHWESQIVNSLRLTGQILVNALLRKQTEQNLNSALLQAKSSDNLKSAFLAGVSHEIRTPMNHILGFIDLLAEDDISESDKMEFIGIMKKSGMDLLRLIDNVIELALIDSGQIKLRKEPCDLNRFMESLVNDAGIMKASLNRDNVKIKLKVDISSGNQIILTDEYRLWQIMNNLISNALKYTLEGTVEIGFSHTAVNTVMFYVSDTGIGIPQEEQQVVFERFHRLDNGIFRSYTGAGLGLSISQGLASLFNSKIALNSQPDKGSSFRFNIPFIAYEVPQLISPLIMHGSGMYDWSGKTALIVEDDPVNVRFLTVLLLKTNIDLLYAADGKEAVELVQSAQVDIVLMDMNLPVIDGYEATRQIKKLRPGLPVIAQTAHALSEDREHCLEVGCNEYLSKPIDKPKLYATIDRFLFPN